MLSAGRWISAEATSVPLRVPVTWMSAAVMTSRTTATARPSCAVACRPMVAAPLTRIQGPCTLPAPPLLREPVQPLRAPPSSRAFLSWVVSRDRRGPHLSTAGVGPSVHPVPGRRATSLPEPEARQIRSTSCRRADIADRVGNYGVWQYASAVRTSLCTTATVPFAGQGLLPSPYCGLVPVTVYVPGASCIV